MRKDLLSTYLNDHLAGSVFALDLLEHCRSRHSAGEVAEALGQLHSEIEEDQAVLRDIMARLDVKESIIKKAGAWLTEKVGQLSLVGSGSSEESLVRLQALEALLVGVRGKLALWELLDATFVSDPRLSEVDLPELERRAEDQLKRIDALRIQAACEAFTRENDITGK